MSTWYTPGAEKLVVDRGDTRKSEFISLCVDRSMSFADKGDYSIMTVYNGKKMRYWYRPGTARVANDFRYELTPQEALGWLTSLTTKA